jgi:hypothetical protein
MDVDRYTLLGNAYYYWPGLDITFKTQYGRFLAGDVGWNLTLTDVIKQVLCSVCISPLLIPIILISPVLMMDITIRGYI